MNAIDLAGEWQILADPDDAGLRDRWFDRPPRAGWRATTVPAAWQHTLGHDYHGVAWYRRRVTLPADWLDGRGRIWLRCRAVATDCTAWVGGVEIGRHVGDYLPFQLPLGTAIDAARAARGEIDILLRVDEIRGATPAVVGKDPWIGHISKGFHDVLSLQHGGVWDAIELVRTPPTCFDALGPHVAADASNGTITLTPRLVGDARDAQLACTLTDADGRPVASGTVRGDQPWRATLPTPLHLWEPERPLLYSLTAEVRAGGLTERTVQRVGLRTLAVAGERRDRIELNGRPLHLRGILHWGHEIHSIAPAPSEAQVRDEFARHRALGFNAVCLCMWYPPESYYRIADETGMLIWQEHPIWKSDMRDELVPEYRRLLEGFLRRDAQHASVVVVSATCEHERFNPALARWWWGRSRELLAGTLRQIQTGFMAWTDPDKTDMFDEHVYDSSGRWTCFVRDLDAHLETLPPKPFAMGETIIGTSWPDVAALRARLGDERPWWTPVGLDACAAMERSIEHRLGRPALDRFLAAADRQHLAIRKHQYELFRTLRRGCALVMNQLADVPRCRLGFRDDLGRWRFTPRDTAGWFRDALLLLETPGQRRGFDAGARVPCRVGVSNYSRATITGPIRVRIVTPGARDLRRVLDLTAPCAPGEISWAELDLDAPAAAGPTPIDITAEAGGVEPNRWRLWSMPRASADGVRLARVEAAPLPDDPPEFAERAYSSGWGLACATWSPWKPDSGALYPEAARVAEADLATFSADVLLSTRLTPRITEHALRGGRVVLLASRWSGAAGGGAASTFFNLYEQIPLIVTALADGSPAALHDADADWVIDLLHNDLTSRSTRAIPTGAAGLADTVWPIIRCIVTHDRGDPIALDVAFATRAGDGLLVVTSLDHERGAGRHLLDRLVRWAAHARISSLPETPPATLRAWCID